MVLVVFLAAAEPIASAFNDDPRVVHVTSLYLTVVALSYGFLGIVNPAAAAFNGLQMPLHAAGIADVAGFLCYTTNRRRRAGDAIERDREEDDVRARARTA